MKVTETLNAICPYFTMFPLEFPERILKRYGKARQTVLDPFAGRGTTLYAARQQGMKGFGIDSNPVAQAISQAKLANTTPARIVASAENILKTHPVAKAIPDGDFWELAFEKSVLKSLCRLREGLFADCRSESRQALRAIVLGGLHGPLGKHMQSYFSNQCPRTYAPKPKYAVTFWRNRGLVPPKVDVIEIIKKRAERFYSGLEKAGSGRAMLGDSQQAEAFEEMDSLASWIITSPPYYGMRTYVPDQWLRNWFLGGSEKVNYSAQGQLPHSSQEDFCDGMGKVWKNCAKKSEDGARMVIRFGAINDRTVDVVEMIKISLRGSGWRIKTCHDAGSASIGKRQADHFVSAGRAISEYDIWCVTE